MKNKILRFLLFCLWICLLLFVTGQTTRGWSLAHDNYISFLLFTMIVLSHLYFARKMTAKAILYNYLGSFAAMYVMVTTIEGWRRNVLGMPNMLFVVLGMISGYIVYSCWKKKSYKKMVIPVAFLGLALLQAFVLQPYWVCFFSYGSFTPNVKESLHVQADMKDRLLKDKNKLYLLDFWSTSCGICFRKFPKVQALYNQYKNSENVAIIAVNVRLPRDTSGMAEKLIESRGYTFPVFVADDGFKMNLGVEWVPTVVMVKGDEIIFRGDIEAAEDFLKNL